MKTKGGKGKQKASVENFGRCDEDPLEMHYDSVPDPPSPQEDPYLDFREMHHLETCYETEELYSNVEFKDDTTKPGKEFLMFRKDTMCKVFKWTLGM